MNFNFAHQPDYQLNTSMIDEMIRLYGTPVKFVLMDKIVDRPNTSEFEVFGGYKTLKTSRGLRDTMEYQVWILLTEMEGFPNGMNLMFGQFGLQNEDTQQAFISVDSLRNIIGDVAGNVHPKEIISNTMVFPNGKVMEITDCQSWVPGVNNTFVYSDRPSCYQLSLRSYNFDRSAVDLAQRNKGSLVAVEPGFQIAGSTKSPESKIHNSTLDPKDIRGMEAIKTQQAIDAFFNNEAFKTKQIHEDAQGEVLKVQDFKEHAIKGAKIDDVFGTF